MVDTSFWARRTVSRIRIGIRSGRTSASQLSCSSTVAVPTLEHSHTHRVHLVNSWAVYLVAAPGQWNEDKQTKPAHCWCQKVNTTRQKRDKKVKGVFGARWCFRSKLEWFSSETFSPNKTPVQIWTWDLRQKCDRNRVDCQEMKQWSEGEDLRWGSPSWWDSPRFDHWGASSAPPSGAPPTPPTRTSGAPMRSLARMEATIGIWAG